MSTINTFLQGFPRFLLLIKKRKKGILLPVPTPGLWSFLNSHFTMRLCYPELWSFLNSQLLNGLSRSTTCLFISFRPFYVIYHFYSFALPILFYSLCSAYHSYHSLWYVWREPPLLHGHPPTAKLAWASNSTRSYSGGWKVHFKGFTLPKWDDPALFIPAKSYSQRWCCPVAPDSDFTEQEWMLRIRKNVSFWAAEENRSPRYTSTKQY